MKKILSLVAIFILLPPTAVNAAPFKDATGKFHIQDAGILVGQKVLVGTDVPVVKNTLYNQCGIATVSAPSSTIPMPETLTVNGVSIDVGLLPLGTIPKCAYSSASGSFQPSIPVTANFRTSDGKVGLVGTANSSTAVTYDGVLKTKSYTANKCGLVSLAFSSAPVTITYGGTMYATAGLPVRVPARCIGGVKYIPAP